MHLYSKLYFILFCFTASFVSYGQNSTKVYYDEVLDDKIASVQLIYNGQPVITPVMPIGSSFTLQFDELAEDSHEFFYKIVHCNRNWQLSDLDEIEFLEGFNGEELQNFDFSINTYVDYVNYSLTLPNEDTRFRISGNYALIIYDDVQLTNPILVKRFMYSEQKATILVDLQRTNDVILSKTHQQLNIQVDVNDLQISNAMTELSIDVIQNNRWDNMISNQTPKFISRGNIQFDNTGKIVFEAGKEFRSFDTRSLDYTTEFVKEINLHNDGSDVILHYDLPRDYREYQDDLDFDGRYVVAIHDFSPDNLMADYSNVYFGLKTNRTLLDELYLIGPFTDWKLKDAYRMQHKEGEGYYTKALLKQGVYNYLYATKGRDGKPVYDYVEGSSYKTVNYYSVILYYRDFIEGFDRILGTQVINSADLIYR